MIRIGIECEQLEQNRFGIGHTLAQFLEYLTKLPNIEKQFRFVLYFKAHVPTDAFLNHPLFEKKVLMAGRGWFKVSFNVFYHILLPLRYWLDRIDIFLFPSNMLPAFFVGKAIVVLVNDVYWEAHKGTIPFRYRISYLLFCWWAAKRAHIMTISEFSKKELQEAYRIPDHRIFVNPWGISPAFHALDRTPAFQRTLEELKLRFGIEGEYLLSIGQAFPRRHVKEAINAFGQIAGLHPTVQYVVACTDKYNPPVLDAVIHDVNELTGRKAIVRVEYLSHDEVLYLMNGARALVYVSSKEALGLPPVEAVLSGTPAILADTPVTRELFGDDGLYVQDPSKPEQISARMSEVLSMTTADAQHVVHIQAKRLSRLNWEEHTQRLLKKFHELSHKNS